MITKHIHALPASARSRVLMGLIGLTNGRIMSAASMEANAMQRLMDARAIQHSTTTDAGGSGHGVDTSVEYDELRAQRQQELAESNDPDPKIEVQPWLTLKSILMDELLTVSPGGKMADQSLDAHIKFRVQAEFQYNAVAARAKLLAANGRVSPEAIAKVQKEEWEQSRRRLILNKEQILIQAENMYGLEGEWELDELFEQMPFYDQLSILSKLADSLDKLLTKGLWTSSYKTRDLGGDASTVEIVEADVLTTATEIFNKNNHAEAYYQLLEQGRRDIALVEKIIAAEKAAAAATRQVPVRTLVKQTTTQAPMRTPTPATPPPSNPNFVKKVVAADPPAEKPAVSEPTTPISKPKEKEQSKEAPPSTQMAEKLTAAGVTK